MYYLILSITNIPAPPLKIPQVPPCLHTLIFSYFPNSVILLSMFSVVSSQLWRWQLHVYSVFQAFLLPQKLILSTKREIRSTQTLLITQFMATKCACLKDLFSISPNPIMAYRKYCPKLVVKTAVTTAFSIMEVTMNTLYKQKLPTRSEIIQTHS